MIALLAAKFASTATPPTIQLFIEAQVHLRSTHRPGIDISAALERCAQVCLSSCELEQRQEQK